MVVLRIAGDILDVFPDMKDVPHGLEKNVVQKNVVRVHMSEYKERGEENAG